MDIENDLAFIPKKSKDRYDSFVNWFKKAIFQKGKSFKDFSNILNSGKSLNASVSTVSREINLGRLTYKNIRNIRNYFKENKWEELISKQDSFFPEIEFGPDSEVLNNSQEKNILNIQKIDKLANEYHYLFPKTCIDDKSVLPYNTGKLTIDKEIGKAVLIMDVERDDPIDTFVKKRYVGQIFRKMGGEFDNIHIIFDDEGSPDRTYIMFKLYHPTGKSPIDFILGLALTSSCGDKPVIHVQTVHRIALASFNIDGKNINPFKNKKFVKDNIMPLLRLGEEQFIIEKDKFDSTNNNVICEFKNQKEKDLSKCIKTVYVFDKKELKEMVDNNEDKYQNLIHELRFKNVLGSLQYDRIERELQLNFRNYIKPKNPAG